jgi:hypothetical protein
MKKCIQLTEIRIKYLICVTTSADLAVLSLPVGVWLLRYLLEAFQGNYLPIMNGQGLFTCLVA